MRRMVLTNAVGVWVETAARIRMLLTKATGTASASILGGHSRVDHYRMLPLSGYYYSGVQSEIHIPSRWSLAYGCCKILLFYDCMMSCHVVSSADGALMHCRPVVLTCLRHNIGQWRRRCQQSASNLSRKGDTRRFKALLLLLGLYLIGHGRTVAASLPMF